MIKKRLKLFLQKVEQLSPRPVLYPFLMTYKEREVFDKAAKSAAVYLEFGAGGSTIRALQKSKATIHSVESSDEWLSEMRKYWVIRFYQNKRLFFHHADIGPTKELGYPTTEEYQELFPKYSSQVFQDVDTSKIDMVLVDGRFRVACVLKTILECSGNRKLKILVHDFWVRPDYHVVLKYLETEERADSLGLFTIKKGIDLNAVSLDYDRYKHISE